MMLYKESAPTASTFTSLVVSVDIVVCGSDPKPLFIGRSDMGDGCRLGLSLPWSQGGCDRCT